MCNPIFFISVDQMLSANPAWKVCKALVTFKVAVIMMIKDIHMANMA